MNEVILFGEDLKENPHKYIKEALDFPDYYGENLDALFDCLTELSNKIIIIKDSSLPDDDLIATFKDASIENPDIKLILD
ncbi:MAG: barstar family protein [Methanobrevibacter sp.]|nr:barstar family protein [Methanobrevibacter sp.]